MSILTLQIKKEHLDNILSGKKKEEFREIRPNTSKKYIEYFDPGDGEGEDVRPKGYETIQFFNGYAKDRPEVIIEIKAAEIEYIVDKEGNFVEYEENGQSYLTAQMVYSLGKIISKKNI
ncbi:ASCH domain-containing protein [Chryseobacterium viscerum]|uniref:ASCH domain-containing protein n=1 Tax=Chryseobacterium viscerum TaxID=1037377 RepID=A0A5N4BJ85_9FLAO|nr:ASCH domain-containing protein [Chryseobacterium viscerum]KAB1228464.1 ASCH domain-containing protein [Chryseobacterium viscerum]